MGWMKRRKQPDTSRASLPEKLMTAEQRAAHQKAKKKAAKK